MNKVPSNIDDNKGLVTNVESSLVSINVNWVTIEVTKEVKVRDVLEKAKEAGAIKRKVDEYVIERVKVIGEIQREEVITVKEQEKFIAVPTGQWKLHSGSDSISGRKFRSVDHRIATELEDLGYEPEVVGCKTPNGEEKAVIFPYRIDAGRFKGETRTIGVSTRCEAVGYPEVPPHWIFISPPITDTRDGSNHGTGSFAGKKWVLLSRPPGAFWDSVHPKNMKAYLEHLSKVFARI